MQLYAARNATNETDVSSGDVVLPSVFLALLMVSTIFGNSLVCAAFYLFRDLRSVTNYFVVSLAVADLLVGFVSMPLWFTILVFNWPPMISGIYILWMCLDIATATASIMNLAVISVDRFYAITAPFQYQRKITKGRAGLYIVLVWIYALTVSSIRATPWFDKWYSFFVATASFFVPLPVMIFCYARIFSVARLQAAKIRELDSVRAYIDSPRNGGSRQTECSVFMSENQSPKASYSSTKPSLGALRNYFSKRPVLTSQSSFRQQRRALSSDIKAAKTLAIVMGAFLLCWTPFIISLLVEVSCPSCIPMQGKYTLAKAVKWLVYSNSALNPVIYTALNRTFRDAFKRVLCRIWFIRQRQNAYFATIPHNAKRGSQRSTELQAHHPTINGDKTTINGDKTEIETILVHDRITVL